MRTIRDLTTGNPILRLNQEERDSLKMWKLSIEVSAACSRFLCGRGLPSLAWDASKPVASILTPTKAQPADEAMPGAGQESNTFGHGTSPGQQLLQNAKNQFRA